MNEKRFEYEEGSDYIRDNKTDEIALYLWEWLHKLNDLSNENEQLKQFKNKISDVLNKNINEYEEYHETQLGGQSYNEAYAMECCVEALVELKKEIYGDGDE